MSVREDHIEMAEFLLKEGASVNFMDQGQRSVLNNDTLVMSNHFNVAECIVYSWSCCYH